MTPTTVNINIYTEAVSKPINKFYPYWIYVNKHTHESAKKLLEEVVKEMQKCRC